MASSCGPPEFYRDTYPHKSQIDEAVSFLHAHKGKVDLVTIDIGANDVLPCIPELASACVQQGQQGMAANLDQIVAELRAAAPGVRIVAMIYYNAFACADGAPVPPGLAAAAQQLILSTNAVLLHIYRAHSIDVADVAGAFSVADLAASAHAAADWTWFCHPDRLGDPHPNSIGYQVIADAFLDVLAPQPGVPTGLIGATLPTHHTPNRPRRTDMIRYVLRGAGAALAVLVTLSTGTVVSAAPAPIFTPPKSYYLALGDSYAYGFQPAKWSAGLPPSAFDTGYVDGFATRLKLIQPGITTVNYSCPGESTVSFLTGPCRWRAAGLALHDDYAGAQVDAAVGFLRAHRGQVSPITLTLWGADLGAFIGACGGDFACIRNGAPAAIGQFAANLSTILRRLREAAPDAEIIVTGAFSLFIGSLDLADPLIMDLNAQMARTAGDERARFAGLAVRFAGLNPAGATTKNCALFTGVLIIEATSPLLPRRP